MDKKIWLAAAGIAVVVLAAAGAFAYVTFFKTETAQLVPTKSNIEEAKPQLTYEDAYNGPLYLTGEKVGSEAPFEMLVANMDRNGVGTIIAYFGIEADQRLYATDNVNTIVRTIKDNPGRFVPFFSPGFGSDEIADMVGDELTSIFRDGLQYSKNAVARGFMQGIGEVEMQAWQTPLTSPEAMQLLDFASSNKLHVMLHIRPDQMQQLEQVVQAYPDTTFLLHLFANDFAQSRSQIIEIMQRRPNLVYTIDADHMMFDAGGQPPIGLLYKYQDQDAAADAEKFTQDFDSKFDELLGQSVTRFKPLIDAMPERVTVGTELSTDYSYEPQVYDSTIKFVRYFIARQNPDVQEKLAYQNAQRLFGKGVTLQ